MPALPLLLLTLLSQDPPATRPAVTLHSGTVGAVVGLDGEVRGLSGPDWTASLLASASIGLAGGIWQELRGLELTPRFEEDSEVLYWSHPLVNLRIALPRGSDVLLCALQFPRPTRLRFQLRADASAGVDFALDVPSRPVETDGHSVVRETDPVPAARVVLVRDPRPETRQGTLTRAAAGAEGILEWAQSDGPAWLSAGARLKTPEPDLDHLYRIALLQLRLAEAGATAGQTLDVSTRSRAACALALAGHAPEAVRLLTVPVSPRDALSAARLLTATRVTQAVCSDAALRAHLGALALELAAGLLTLGTSEEVTSQGVTGCFADPAQATSPARSAVLDGMDAAATVLAESRPAECAALRARVVALRARLRDEAWRPELSRLVKSPTAAGADAELLGLATSALLLPGSGALAPFDERIEATVARVLERLLSAEGLLGSSGEWRAENTVTPASAQPAVAATCRLVARRLQLGDLDSARRTLMALVRKASTPASHPLRLLPDAWHQTTGAALGEPSPGAAAEYALTVLLFLVGAQPPPDPRKADLLIAPSFPEDWKVSRVVNCPDPRGSFDLDLLREAHGVRLRLTRRRGEPVRILVRAWKTLATTEDTVVEILPGKPAELLLPTPPLRPSFKLTPGEPIIVPSAPAELRQRILAWVEAERLLAGRDLTKDLQHQDAPFDGDVAGYAAAVEALRRQAEARFETRRATGR